MNASIPSGHKLRFGPFTADPCSGELCRKNGKIKLQTQPFQVLVLLLERHGETVTRQDIKQKLWPDEQSGDFGDRINTAIRQFVMRWTTPTNTHTTLRRYPKWAIVSSLQLS
jgi:cholera toxin transcriptional activator